MSAATTQDDWSTREKLILSQAVYRYGENNWSQIARILRNHPLLSYRGPDFFTQKTCSLKFHLLMEELEAEKRQQRQEAQAAAASSSTAQDMPPVIKLARRFYIQHREDLQSILKEQEEKIQQLRQDIDDIQAGKWDEQLQAYFMEKKKEEEKQKAEEMPSAESSLVTAPLQQAPSPVASETTTQQEKQPEIRQDEEKQNNQQQQQPQKEQEEEQKQNVPEEAVAQQQQQEKEEPPKIVEENLPSKEADSDTTQPAMPPAAPSTTENEEIPSKMPAKTPTPPLTSSSTSPPTEPGSQPQQQPEPTAATATEPSSSAATKNGELSSISSDDSFRSAAMEMEDTAVTSEPSRIPAEQHVKMEPEQKEERPTKRSYEDTENEEQESKRPRLDKLTVEVSESMVLGDKEELSSEHDLSNTEEVAETRELQDDVVLESKSPEAATDRQSIADGESVTGSESNAPTPTSTTAGKRQLKDEQKQQKSWQKNISLMWREIANHKNGAMFMNPIKEINAPRYYDIVKQPMDLKTIKSRIKNGSIRTTVEFERDVILMLTNSLMYNKEGTEVYQMAREMLEDVTEQMKLFKTADSNSATSSHTRKASTVRRKSIAE